jgi:hypothetical protein
MEVGTRVFIRGGGNNARYTKDADFIECEVTKVGRLYFYLKSVDGKYFNADTKFFIKTLRSKIEYNSEWKVYGSKQVIYDEIEFDALYSKIRLSFDWTSKCKYTLEQLRSINKIVFGSD